MPGGGRAAERSYTDEERAASGDTPPDGLRHRAGFRALRAAACVRGAGLCRTMRFYSDR